MIELLLRGLLVLVELIAEVIVGYILYGTGWLVLRLLTLGRYPDYRCVWPTRWAHAAPGSRRSVPSAWWAQRLPG